MLSRQSVLILILGGSILLEAVFLVLLGKDISPGVIALALAMGVALLGYVMASANITSWSNRSMERVAVERAVQTQRMSVHDLNYIEVTVTNPTAQRFDAVRVIDYYPESFTLVKGANTCCVCLPPYSFAKFAYVLRANERGTYRVGGTVVSFTDSCGYTMDNRVLENQTKLFVYPQVGRVVERRLRTLSERQVAGTKRSRKKGTGFDYVGSRKYISGDELKLVDWKYFAKTSEPGTKEYNIERNVKIMLMLDCSQSMNAGTGRYSKLDCCVDSAAYLAYQLLRQGDSVGILTCSRQHIGFFRPDIGDSAYHRIFETLATAESESGHADLERCAFHALRKMDSKALFIILTDAENGNSLVRAVKAIKASGHEVVLITPYVSPRHYTGLLTHREARSHDPEYLFALSQFLFMDEIMGITETVGKVSRMGVKCIAAPLDRLQREIVLRLGVAR